MLADIIRFLNETSGWERNNMLNRLNKLNPQVYVEYASLKKTEQRKYYDVICSMLDMNIDTEKYCEVRGTDNEPI